MGWIFSAPVIFMAGPTIIVLTVIAVSDFLSVRDIIGVIIGASSIAILVRHLNRRDDPLDGQRHSDLDDF